MMKVRFNLGRGKNFMKWKVSCGSAYEIFDPEEGSLILRGCKLINKRTQANRIFNGHNKFVVAWIECEHCEYIEGKPSGENKRDSTEVRYNPKINPYWSIYGVDVDDMEIDRIYTIGNKVMIG